MNNKMIVITGKKGIGKTVVCRRLVDLAPANIGSCGGVITYKLPGGSMVIEDITSMKQMVLAGSSNAYRGPIIDNYSFNPAAMKFRLGSIERARTLPLMVVDELGLLETNPESGGSALKLLDEAGDGSRIVVVDENVLPDLLHLMGKPDSVFSVTMGNRNSLPDRIIDMLKA
jgi:nucleoside-triphosphatase THEP1